MRSIARVWWGIVIVVILGGVSSRRVSGQDSLQTGYSVFVPDAGSRPPVGTALFSFTNSSGVLVSQAGVGGVQPARTGRIFVDEARTPAGLALVNSTSSVAAATLILRNAAGVEIARRGQALGANEHLARFVHELFPGQAQGLRGSLTFESDQPLAAITLRESRNAQDEPLYTTLPVVDPAAASSAPVFFPQIAAGGGYTSELLLMNTGDDPITGDLRFFASNGEPLSLRTGTADVSQLPYRIEGNGTFRAEFDAGELKVGWAAASPSQGTRAPQGSAVFRFSSGGHIVSEAGVAATSPTTLARIFVDNGGSRTGVAIANPSGLAANLTLTLMDKNSNVEATVNRALPAGNHVAVFAHELFPDLTEGFTGLLEIRSTAPIVPITLKLTANSRGESILTTLPVADLNRASSAASLIFPHIAIGGGFSTRLILINDSISSVISGTLRFHRSDGAGLVVPLGANVSSQFTYLLPAGAGRQSYPGNTARVSLITLVDPSTQRDTRELAINEGASVRPRVRLVDSAGQSRDDYEVTFAPTNPDVAAVNVDGSISGKAAGFSTVAMSAAGVVAAANITVVRVDAGLPGFSVSGVAQDSARGLYLAASQEQAVLYGKDPQQTPAVYAGIRSSPGLKNDLRLQSQFRNPAFLAFSQSQGDLYVSDTANHVIRRIRPGASGRVETLAGTGIPGVSDASLQTASFNTPQGIALDSRGYLWIADSGNHTIRRINLVAGTVDTVAGKPGAAGLSDGAGSAAQFRAPMGIAVETENALQQLARESRGEPPPPVSVIVADTGNGVLRRVRENGAVETLRAVVPATASTLGAYSQLAADPSPIVFDRPTGIAIDALQNIYVTEPEVGRTRVVLRTGDVVSVAQPKTFHTPVGLSTTEDGRLIVTDGPFGTPELNFGGPQILSVTPSSVSDLGGAPITIRGRNFAPDSIVVIGGTVVSSARIENTETITLTAPTTGAGRTTITVQNRAGLGQAPIVISPQPLSALPIGYITTVAGGTTFAGDGVPAISSLLINPYRMAIDPAGAVYIADFTARRVRRIDPRTGIINTVAGTGRDASVGDNGPAIAASLTPYGIAVDRGGNVFVTDSVATSGTTAYTIRRIDAKTSIITTIAGGSPGFAGDGGPAANARFFNMQDLAVDTDGNLYICDTGNHRIRRIDAKTNTIDTIAGAGPTGGAAGGFSGDGGPATAARFSFPSGVTLDSAGNVYVSDSSNRRIRKIDAASGVVTTVAGNGENGFYGDGGPATAAAFSSLADLSVDADDNLYIVGGARVRKVDAATGIITTLAGGGSAIPGIAKISPLSADLGSAGGVAVDAAGNVLISVVLPISRIYRIEAGTGLLQTLAGLGSDSIGDSEAASAAILNLPNAVAVDAQGNLLIGEIGRLRRVDARTGIITTIAGTGGSGTTVEGPALTVPIETVTAIAVDGGGDIYFADGIFGTHRVRKLMTATGMLTTVATVPTTNPLFGGVGGVAVGAGGNVYFSDRNLSSIYRVSGAGNAIYAGNGGTCAQSGDGGPATSASLCRPEGLAVDAAGNLYIADTPNNRIRRVAASTGVITTVAGVSTPNSIALDPAGNIYWINATAGSVGRFVPATLSFQTIVRARIGFSGDNGPAIDSALNLYPSPINTPGLIAIDAQGNIFIADTRNNRIRAIKGPLP